MTINLATEATGRQAAAPAASEGPQRGMSIDCANGCHAPLCAGCSCDCH